MKGDTLTEISPEFPPCPLLSIRPSTLLFWFTHTDLTEQFLAAAGDYLKQKKGLKALQSHSTLPVQQQTADRQS